MVTPNKAESNQSYCISYWILLEVLSIFHKFVPETKYMNYASLYYLETIHRIYRLVSGCLLSVAGGALLPAGYCGFADG